MYHYEKRISQRRKRAVQWFHLWVQIDDIELSMRGTQGQPPPFCPPQTATTNGSEAAQRRLCIGHTFDSIALFRRRREDNVAGTRNHPAAAVALIRATSPVRPTPAKVGRTEASLHSFLNEPSNDV